MAHPATSSSNASPAFTKMQRAIGALSVSAFCDPQRGSQLKDLRQQGSFRVIFPRSAPNTVDAVMLNTAGGVTGGDQFTIDACAHEAAQLSLTTQAAERIYGAVGADAGTIKTRLNIEENARLNWLPQETILFDHCNLTRRLDVTLAASASFLMVEPLVFGREASGETLTNGVLDDQVRITRDGELIYFDRIHLAGDIAAQLKTSACANGARALASLVLVDQNASAHLDAVRALQPETGGASLLANDILVIRLLTPDSYTLRKTLLPLLVQLTHDTVPKNWRL